MSKFTFTCEEVEGKVNTARNVQFSAVHLDDIIEEFELFLKGCGFYFDGHLTVMDDDFTPTEEVIHSKYYYETDRNK